MSRFAKVYPHSEIRLSSKIKRAMLIHSIRKTWRTLRNFFGKDLAKISAGFPNCRLVFFKEDHLQSLKRKPLAH